MSPSSSSSGPPPTPERRPVLSLADERERVVQELSLHFASDNLSLDELEARMERAYKAATVADLQTLTADLPRGVRMPEAESQSKAVARPGAAPVPVEPSLQLVPDRERVWSVMSETKRRGAWPMPQRLDLTALMSDTTIDLTQATIPTGVVDVHIRSMWAAVKIIVPPGLQVVNRISSLMGSVGGGSEPDDEKRGAPAWRSGTVVRLSGWALMAEVQVKVRRRERDASDDDSESSER